MGLATRLSLSSRALLGRRLGRRREDPALRPYLTAGGLGSGDNSLESEAASNCAGCNSFRRLGRWHVLFL